MGSALRAGAIVDEDSDIANIRYTITSCGKPDSSLVVVRPLEDQLIPGNIYDLQNTPLEEESGHLFADLFQSLTPGCYDIHVQPLNELGKASEVCAPAWKEDVMVLEAQTTEVLLIIQCAGSDPGAIDAIAAINHEPNLDEVYFVESKFVCGSAERICMNATDVDNDPLEFELIAPEGCEVALVETEVEDDACFDLTCHDWGRFDLGARVYDLAWKDDTLIRIEDWLALEGYPHESHGELNFYAYFDGIKYYPDADSDGFGDDTAIVSLVCKGDVPPVGYVQDNTDCDDSDATIYPGATEICDSADNNCDGEVDEGLTLDEDGDGHTTPDSCEGSKDDCYDDDPTIYECCLMTADIVLFHDLSGSFRDDLPNVKRMAPVIYDRLIAEGVDIRLGVASFIDKPYAPFGISSDYVFKINYPLTSDKTTFVNAVNSLRLGSGSDYPESQIEGLMHTGTHADIPGGLGFRDAAVAKRYVIMMTDARYHQNGDCVSAGPCTSGNNGDGVIDLYEDYPTIDQVASALAAEEIIPIFAVTTREILSYQILVEDLAAAGSLEGTVVPLASDSSNIVDAVMAGLNCD
ncbi:MAG: MopE-related protein [Myxococcota bacterium]|nr:MopE-related protein [Myxococcota bacterium]